MIPKFLAFLLVCGFLAGGVYFKLNSVKSTAPLNQNIPVEVVRSTPSPETQLTEVVPQVQGDCAVSSYKIDTEAYSFCYPASWKAEINADKEIALFWGEDAIYIHHYPNLDLPHGSKDSLVQSKNLTVDGYAAMELKSDTSMGLFIFNKKPEPVDNSAFLVTYRNLKGQRDERIPFAFTMIEKSFHVKSWDTK